MAFYRPSLVVNFRLRFDGTFSLRDAPPKPTSVADRLKLVPADAPPSHQPLVLSDGPMSVSRLLGRVPESGSVDMPGLRQAASFNFTFPYRDLPIDPRLLQACGVEVHLGTVDHAAFGAGVTAASVAGQRASHLTCSDENSLMVGIVDSWEVSHGETSTVSMSGRDLRGLLIDSPITDEALSQIDLTEDIVNVVRQILAAHPFGERMVVMHYPDDWSGLPGPPSPGTVDNLTRIKKGASGKGKGGAAPIGRTSDTNFWDMIVQYCFLCGAIPYFVGQHLWIRPALSLYDQQKIGVRTPFQYGYPRLVQTSKGTERLKIRRLVLGRDINELRFSRKFGGNKPQVVEVYSIDSDSEGRGEQRLVSARYPDEAALSSPNKKVAPSGQVASSDVMRVPVAGVNDVEQLRLIAINVFEEIARGEVGGSVSTKVLASFGGDNQDPDLLRLRPGDAMEFFTDQRNLSSFAPLVGEPVEHSRRPFNDEVAEVAARIGDERLARAIVATSRGNVAELTRFFRVEGVKYSWDRGSVGVSFDFQNFVEVQLTRGSANLLPPVARGVRTQKVSFTDEEAGAITVRRESIEFSDEEAGDLVTSVSRVNFTGDES